MQIDIIAQQLQTAQRMYYWPQRHALVFNSPSYGFILVDIGGTEPGLSPIAAGERLRDVALLPDHITESMDGMLDRMPYYADTFTAQVLGMVEMPCQQELVDLALAAVEQAVALPSADTQQEETIQQEEAVALPAADPAAPAPTAKRSK